MIVQILIVSFILLAAGAVFWVSLSFSNKKDQGIVSQTLDAWRADDRQLDEFDVTVSDASVGDLFSEFPEDTSAYIEPEVIDRVVENEMGTHVRPLLSKVRNRQGKDGHSDGVEDLPANTA
ncbi:MAG: hypothetical protein Q3979_09135 [Actinomycetaceae bacterium]|nr:hypothetical protein [Actinomycetaceae bacterium]